MRLCRVHHLDSIETRELMNPSSAQRVTTSDSWAARHIQEFRSHPTIGQKMVPGQHIHLKKDIRPNNNQRQDGRSKLHSFEPELSQEEVRYALVRPLASSDLSLTHHGAAVLGATGSVGQRFILLLALHPHFTLHAVGASERSAGKKYKDAVNWKQSLPMSKELGELVVRPCKASEFMDCDLVFSGLDSSVAGEVGTCANHSGLSIHESIGPD